jgi:hypothetical protein
LQNVHLKGQGKNSTSQTETLVYIKDGSLTMKGDSSISENRNPGYGGGVYVDAGGAFTMQDNASVYDNKATDVSGGGGGGVYVTSNGTFTMDGGTIYGNEAEYGGGGVYVDGASAIFTMTGGTIYGSEANVQTGEPFNTAGNGASLYVDGGTAKYGTDLGGGTIVTSGNSTDITLPDFAATLDTGSNTKGYFTLKEAIWDANSSGGTITLLKDVETDKNGETDGYMISTNITLKPGSSGGRTIKQGDSDSYLFGVSAIFILEGNLTIDGGGDDFAGTNRDGVEILSGGTLKIYDGVTITGFKNTGNSRGGGVNVYGTFYMYGGVIAGNSAGANGGGVYVSGGIFNMSGGTIGKIVDETDGSTIIEGNTALNGGGVYVDTYGTFTMSDTAKIQGNEATDGGGVYITGTASTSTTTTFTMSGGIIAGNKATTRGGGVYMNYSTFEMSGGYIYGSDYGTESLRNKANPTYFVASLYFYNSGGSATYKGDYAGKNYGKTGDTITNFASGCDDTLPPLEGSPVNPILIKNVGDFDKIIPGTSGVGKHYKIDDSVTTPIELPSTWTPIGTSTNTFQGNFDGNGKTIEMNITTISGGDNYAGLFGYIGSGGIVKNLKLTGSITSDKGYVGALAGRNSGTVSNISSSVDVECTYTTALSHAGGLVGENWGPISNCYTTGDVKATSPNVFIAGITTGNSTATIEYCWASGNIIAQPSAPTGSCVAGIHAGNPDPNPVSNCVALNPSISSTPSNSSTDMGRVCSNNKAFPTGTKSWAIDSMTVSATPKDTATGTVTTAQARNMMAWWTGTTNANWTVAASKNDATEANPWYWDTIGNVPRLRFDDEETLPITPITPVLDDFTITGNGDVTWDDSAKTGTVTYDGTAKSVKVTAKSGKTTGTVTVKYDGSTTAPTNAGTYAVTFTVTADGNYNAVTLTAGTLKINPATPTAADFVITGAGTYLYDGTTRPVTVVLRTGITGMSGTRTVSYTDKITGTTNTTAPSAVGTYIVTIGVTAGENYAAVTGLSAGTLIIGNSISNRAGLEGISLTGTYVLTGDIDVTGTWTPLGSGANSFKGTLDGNGHTITMDDLVIPVVSVMDHGLFGTIGQGGEVKNLKLAGTVSFTGNNETMFGPLAGLNRGTIRNIASSVDVIVTNTVLWVYGGGIAGRNTDGLIENCYSTGNISVTFDDSTTTATTGTYIACAGGIAGERYSGTIRNCWAGGTISANVPYLTSRGAAAGGIVGTGSGVDNCVALNSSVKAEANGSTANAGRISGTSNAGTNYANSAMTVNQTIAGTTTVGTENGDDVSLATAGNLSWWTATAKWTVASTKSGATEANPWVWNDTNTRPVLWFEMP